jgi:hypothetical protein
VVLIPLARFPAIVIVKPAVAAMFAPVVVIVPILSVLASHRRTSRKCLQRFRAQTKQPGSANNNCNPDW